MKNEKRLHRAELIVLALTLACALFTAGYFTGKTTPAGVVTVEKLSGVSQAAPDSNSAGDAAPSPSAVISSEPDDASTVSSPASETSGAAKASGASEMPSDGLKININTATLTELDSLPGVGPVIAGNIISYRQAHGGFKTPEELLDVDGIGQKKFDALKDYITVGS
jgi:competence protein ComEA